MTMSVELHCSCGASMTSTGSLAMIRAAVEAFANVHMDCGHIPPEERGRHALRMVRDEADPA